ncbi:hypothetical protein TNCV_1607961 [Trichonephila clavipes]|nr:hypothetical protein TNCV_1607961 [Trichonephila clavipes]
MFVFFRGVVGDKFVFMDDNVTFIEHSGFLDSEGIQRLWPARSSDLNPIENVGMLWGGKLLVETILRQTKHIRALTEEWDKLPQQLLDNVVQSMVRRVECCITL